MTAVDETCGKEKLGEASADVEKFIKELGKFDPKGEAFRYPETTPMHEFPQKGLRSITPLLFS